MKRRGIIFIWWAVVYMSASALVFLGFMRDNTMAVVCGFLGFILSGIAGLGLFGLPQSSTSTARRDE